jgi:hypothetical protein
MLTVTLKIRGKGEQKGQIVGTIEGGQHVESVAEAIAHGGEKQVVLYYNRELDRQAKNTQRTGGKPKSVTREAERRAKNDPVLKAKIDAVLAEILAGRA